MNELTSIKYNAQGLVPAIVQDKHSNQVLMMAWMNSEALNLTVQTQQVYFWSRSRHTLWRKGEPSGNTLTVCDILVDCDSDVLLLLVEPSGPACHTGHRSCFYRHWEN